jgi:hypothetical protein
MRCTKQREFDSAICRGRIKGMKEAVVDTWCARALSSVAFEHKHLIGLVSRSFAPFKRGDRRGLILLKWNLAISRSWHHRRLKYIFTAELVGTSTSRLPGLRG